MSEPRSSELIRALELAQAVAAGRDADAVLSAILDSALELTKGERGFVVVPGADGRNEVRAARNYGKRSVPATEARVSGTLVGRALGTGEAVLVASVADDPRFKNTKSLRDLGTRSAIVAPLVAHGRMLGAVLVEDRRRLNAFSGAELRLLELIAAQAALALDGARERETLEREVIAAKRDASLRRGAKGRRFERLVGSSPAFTSLVARLERVCATDAAVLVEGESGTGKELVARTLHENGRRRTAPFVAVNVTEIAESLLEPELFGHSRGAYTGADTARPGLLRQADGGTLFLNEIGELPKPLQAKLLRFLQEKTVRAVGSGQSRSVDVRVIAATNRDLRAAVRSGEFREDLYYRLNVVGIELPPLRARREDIAHLASHFLCAIGAEQKQKPRVLSRAALEALEDHRWPGNVRELENAIRRAVVLGSDPIEPDDLALGREQKDVGLATLEREAALRALEHSDGSVARAARSLGIHRATLYRKLRAWGLKVLERGRSRA